MVDFAFIKIDHISGRKYRATFLKIWPLLNIFFCLATHKPDLETLTSDTENQSARKGGTFGIFPIPLATFEGFFSFGR